jgi:aminopeptidase N
VLAALHKELGDETFLTFLKSYQKSVAWKFGSTKTLAALLQFMTKKDYMPFFDKYYWGTEMPKD